MAVFNLRMRPEVVQPFWAALQAGEFITGAAEQAGSYREMGSRWIAAERGIRPASTRASASLRSSSRSPPRAKKPIPPPSMPVPRPV